MQRSGDTDEGFCEAQQQKHWLATSILDLIADKVAVAKGIQATSLKSNLGLGLQKIVPTRVRICEEARFFMLMLRVERLRNISIGRH